MELERQLAQFGRNDSIQDLLTTAWREAPGSLVPRLTVLHAMAQASLKSIPVTWSNVLAEAIADQQEPIVRAAIAVIRSVPAAKTNFANFSAPLRRLALDSTRPPELKLEALAALPPPLRHVEPQLYEFLCSNLNPEGPLLRRNAAASLLGKARLNNDQLLELCDRITRAAPLELSMYA